VSNYKSEQRRLVHRGREFHFVSYEGHIANERRGEKAMPPMWYLMSEGKRCPVMPHIVGQDPLEVDYALTLWADENAFMAKTKVQKRA
jgi:hypothetical protein